MSVSPLNQALSIALAVGLLPLSLQSHAQDNNYAGFLTATNTNCQVYLDYTQERSVTW